MIQKQDIDALFVIIIPLFVFVWLVWGIFWAWMILKLFFYFLMVVQKKEFDDLFGFFFIYLFIYFLDAYGVYTRQETQGEGSRLKLILLIYHQYFS